MTSFTAPACNTLSAEPLATTLMSRKPLAAMVTSPSGAVTRSSANSHGSESSSVKPRS